MAHYLELGSFLRQIPGHIAVGGHRGMGMNLWTSQGILPSHRENTIISFLDAAKHGVSFVEFDVQVTIDGIPVLWHDDLVISGDTDAPCYLQVKDMTLAEFQGLEGNSQLLRTFGNKETLQNVEGLQLWDCTHDGVLPTLEQVFALLPESIGLDIEVKMPSHAKDPTTAEEIERVLSAIWPVVDSCTATGKRAVAFSSFDPDICVALQAKQSRVPVFFLTYGGPGPLHQDPRRHGFAAAVAFAEGEGLAGVVVDIESIIGDLSIIKSATMKGLEVITYGLGNTHPDKVKAQCDAGVHAVIVDDVEHVLPMLHSTGKEEVQA